MEFWNAVLAVIIVGLLAYGMFCWLIYAPWKLGVDLYQRMRYTRKGICPKCKKRLHGRAERVDQTYNMTDTMVRAACSCGYQTTYGNRRFGDWAGF